jgi:EmrB/QacA subfamily drug resistance transporter
METRRLDKTISGYNNLSKKNLTWTIIGLQVTLLLAALDQTIVSTAMPRIIADLNGFERYAWVTTAYLLTSTATLPVIGRLADMHSRKWILLIAAAGFVASSALCGMAGYFPPFLGDGMLQLIIFRGLQGIAGGAIMSLIFTVLADLFPPAERGKYQGLFSAVFALASVIGPAIGGWLTDSLSWRWVFYVNLPVGIIALAVLYFAFPDIKKNHIRKHSLDAGGVIAFVGWVSSLLLALTWAPMHGLSSPLVICSIVATVLFFAFFVHSESRSEEPMIPLEILKNPIILISSISLMVISLGMFGAILFVPLYFQGVLGTSAIKSGSLLTPMMLMITAGSAASGQICSRMKHYKWVALSGLTLMTIGMFFLSHLSITTDQSHIVFNTLIVGLGLGLVMPFYTLVSQNAVAQDRIGIATAVTQFFRSIGGTLGAAIFNSILMLRYHEYFKSHMPADVPLQAQKAFENPLKLEHIHEQLNSALGNTTHAVQLHDTLLNILKQSLVHAVDTIFLVATCIMFCCLIINLFLEERPLRRGPRPVQPSPADPEVVVPRN